MAGAKRQAAKNASSKIEKVEVFSDASASSFEAASPPKDDEFESEIESDFDELEISFEVKDNVEAKKQREPLAPKPKKFKMSFADESRSDDTPMVVDDEKETIPDQGPPPEQKFKFHNPKYTPKLQLDEEIFQKFQDALLAQLPGVKAVGDVLTLKMASGRIPCPLKKCDKSFLNFEGIKYHLLNFVHFYECLGLDSSECDLSRDYWPIIIPWTMTCKPRKKDCQFGFLIGFPSSQNDIDANNMAGKEKKRLSLVRNQNVKVDKFSPKNLKKNFLPILLTQPKLTKNSVFYKSEQDSKVAGEYFDFEDGGFIHLSLDTADLNLNESLPELPDLDINVNKEKFKILGYQSKRFNDPHTHMIVNCGFFVKCMEWNNKYIVVGGETDDTINGMLQIYEVKGNNVNLKILIKHNFGTVMACKWCLDSFDPEKRLGFLMATFGDGGIRMLDIPFPKEEKILYLVLEKPLFQFIPKGYAFTSLAWENKKNWVACGTDHGNALL